LKKSSLRLRRLAVSAMCLSIALVLARLTTFYIPFFGQNGMKVGISGIFSTLPSFLFGPFYGAAVSGLSDLLGFVLNPVGAYLPQMTAVVALGGFIRGGLWLLLKNKKAGPLRVAILLFAVLLLAFGAFNMYALRHDGVDSAFYDRHEVEAVDTSEMHAVSRMVIERTIKTSSPSGNLVGYLLTMTWGLLASGAMAALTIVVDFVICRILPERREKSRFLAVLVAMLLSGLVVTTLNTVILREVLFESWKMLPFTVVWLPRVIEEIVSACVKSYFIAALLGAAEKSAAIKNLKK